MNPSRLVAWGLVILAAILLLVGIDRALGYIPFTPQYAAKRSAVKVENLEGQVSSLEATATGNAEIGQAVETHHSREVTYRDITSQAETEARTAPDAEAPLSDERLARLRRADRLLCDASGLCATAAPDAP